MHVDVPEMEQKQSILPFIIDRKEKEKKYNAGSLKW